MAPLPLLLCLLAAALSPSPARAARFTCNATAPRANTCQALISYAPPPNATLAAVRALFQLRSHRGLLAANGLPPSTPTTAPASSLLRVRLPCLCSGGVGATFQRPTYRVRAGDTLDAVARGVFAGLVTFQEIAAANNVSDPNRVAVGQELWIPVPCSCDPVAGQPAVHLTYVAPAGSSVAGIAQEFGTTEETIVAVNRMPDAKSLLAGQVLDVPLRACGSNISNTAVDRNLLVPNGTYILTANNCVSCACSSNTWQLDCQPTQGLSTSTCPIPSVETCSSETRRPPQPARPPSARTPGTPTPHPSPSSRTLPQAILAMPLGCLQWHSRRTLPHFGWSRRRRGGDGWSWSSHCMLFSSI